jgi:hypothetical protein
LELPSSVHLIRAQSLSRTCRQVNTLLRGMRITGSVVLKMLAAGKSVQDVLAAYPELEAEDVQQAMRYAAWVVSDQIPALSA